MKNPSILLAGFMLTAATLVSVKVSAQQFNDAGNMPWGGFDVTPTIDLGLHYSDNVTRESDNEISSWSRIISPQITMDSALGASQVSFAYRLTDEAFFSSSADNYTDHFFLVESDIEFDERNRLLASANFEDGHDARGSNFSIGLGDTLTSPDTYKQSSLDFLYSYGAFNAKGGVDINLALTELDYDINTPIYRARDREFVTLAGIFYYRVGLATRAVFEIRHTDVSYQSALIETNPLDSQEMSYLVGVEWEATSQTSGYAKIGYQEKDFSSGQREDFDGFDWELGVLWEPLEYTSLELITRSSTDETNGEGNFILSDRYSLEWRHEWLERVRSLVRVSYNNQRYEGQNIDEFSIRVDDNSAFRASVYYQFRRWLNFEVGYIYDERESNRNEIDFGRNQFLFNALVTL